LCQAIAKEAIFGPDLMATCSPTGGGKSDGRALPTDGMELLKETMFKFFPQYQNCPHQFESQWKICHRAVEQACGRLRREREKRQR